MKEPSSPQGSPQKIKTKGVLNMRLERVVEGNHVILGYRRKDGTFRTLIKTRRRHSSVPGATSAAVEDDIDKLCGVSDQHLLHHLWRCFLAAAGLLDILAWVLPDYVTSSLNGNAGFNEEAGSEMAQRALGDDPPGPFAAADGSFPPWFLEFTRWLDIRNTEICLFFSFLWLVNVIFSARNRHRRAVMEEERRLLTGIKEDNVTVETKKWALVAYHASVLLQFLLLPVGFYLGVGSVIDVVILRCSRSIMGALKARIDLLTKTIMSKASSRLLKMAVQNPYKFYQDLQEFLAVLRWIKYLAPLIAVGNKLLGETLNALKKNKLWAHAKQMKKATQLLWGEKEKKKLTKDLAATAIQASFRAHFLRRARSSMLLMRNGKEHQLLLMIQRRFRQKIVDARERTASKKWELKRLQMMRRRNSVMMSDEDKRKMYQLQDELGKQASDVLNRKLLLRPNTKFAVFWKAFVIVAVLCDVTHKAVKPLLRDGTTGEFVARSLVPRRLSESATCQAMEKVHFNETDHEDSPWYCQESIVKWQGGLRDVAALALIPEPVSEWPECQEKKRTAIERVLQRSPEQRQPWYCKESHPDRHAAYRMFVDYVLDHIRYALGIVMFLDVFVTFFTGRFHEHTGELIPAPWFLRWLFPGLVFQLIVNPNAAGAARVAKRCLGVMFAMGPYRTYQHVVAVGFPLAYLAVRLFVGCVWLPLVSSANKADKVSSPILKSGVSTFNF